MASPEARLIIGLDYGTTSTGVAFQIGEGEFNLVKNWPGGVFSDRVPSNISYSPSPGGCRQWGELDQQVRSHELNLTLEALSGMMNFTASQQVHEPPVRLVKDSVEIIADYLERVREVLWYEILQYFGPVVLETTPICLVVTVLGNWSEPAKNRFFHAICNAGFGKIHFAGLREVIMIPEEEAMIISVLNDLRIEDLVRPELGDSIVVCHTGGISVNLSSFQLRRFTPDLEIKGVTIGTSSFPCGELSIDRSFRQWLEKRLGARNWYILTRDTPYNPQYPTLEPLMVGITRDFEVIKTNFAGIREYGDAYLTLPRPLHDLTDLENGIRDGEIHISEQDLVDIFQPLVTRILELITGQISSVELAGSRVKGLILYGDFSTLYLRSKVGEFLQPRRIKFYDTGDEGLTLALRGAMSCVVHGDMNKMVHVRKCGMHFGLLASRPFTPSKHSEADAYHDPFDGQRKAKEQMTWLVKKGDAIMSDQHKRASISLSRKFGRKDPRMFKTVLVGCCDDSAPQRFTDISMDNRCVAPITYDFTDIPESELTLVRGVRKGGSYLVVDFEINLEIQFELETNVDIWVTCNGKEKRRMALNWGH